jgi:uncharacterized protein (TIGR02594 family)
MRPIDFALQLVGIHEEENLAELQKWHKYLSVPFRRGFAWCGLFVLYCHKLAGIGFLDKIDTEHDLLAARNWLRVGSEPEKPQTGDVVVFSRGDPKSWQGHVGFYLTERAGFIWVLGGNQNDQVKILKYPSSQMIGIRRFENEQTTKLRNFAI